MLILDNTLMELDLPNCLEFEIQALGQQSLDQLAKMLADEWTGQREKD